MMKSILLNFQRFRADESGTTAIEYGLICGLFVLVIIAGITAVGDETNGNFQSAVDAFPD